jgi:hypothetical protein
MIRSSRLPILLEAMSECDGDGKGRNVRYIWSEEYERVCGCLPSNVGRVYTRLVCTNKVLTDTLPHTSIWIRQTYDVHLAGRRLTIVL